MKKTILIAGFSFAVLLSTAQIKVYTGGKVYVGGTTTTPNSLLSVGGAGNSLFSTYSYNPATTLNGATAIRADIAAPTISGISQYAVTGVITPGTVSTSVGVAGASYRSTPASGSFAYGVYGYAGNADPGRNFGVYGLLLGSNNGAGIVGNVGSTYINIPGKYAGYFNGELRTTDDTPEKPSGGSWVTASDKRVKKDIKDFTDGLSVLRKIKPVNYKYNGIGGYPTLNSSVGIIAQEVQQVAPYCIGKTKIIINANEKANFQNDIITTLHGDTATGGEDKYVAEILNYNQDGLFYVMLNSIKQLDSTVTDLQKQLNSCCKAKTNATSRQGNEPAIHDLELANNTVLFQNFPNPFGDGTTIKYFIPDNVTNAQIVFFDEFGNKLKEFVVEEKGMGQLNITTSNLASGVYSYSLIVNGKAIDSKKMVKTR